MNLRLVAGLAAALLLSGCASYEYTGSGGGYYRGYGGGRTYYDYDSYYGWGLSPGFYYGYPSYYYGGRPIHRPPPPRPPQGHAPGPRPGTPGPKPGNGPRPPSSGHAGPRPSRPAQRPAPPSGSQKAPWRNMGNLRPAKKK